jgi:hypothetical protein
MPRSISACFEMNRSGMSRTVLANQCENSPRSLRSLQKGKGRPSPDCRTAASELVVEAMPGNSQFAVAAVELMEVVMIGNWRLVTAVPASNMSVRENQAQTCCPVVGTLTGVRSSSMSPAADAA